MSALLITGAILLGIAMIVAVAIAVTVVVDRRNASPKERYRRNLRSIRRIREDIRPDDPHATQIGPNRDAVIGYRS